MPLSKNSIWIYFFTIPIMKSIIDFLYSIQIKYLTFSTLKFVKIKNRCTRALFVVLLAEYLATGSRIDRKTLR